MNREADHLEYQIPLSQAEYMQILIRSHFPEADLSECLKIERELSFSDIRVRVWYCPEQENRLLVVMTLGADFDDLIEKYEKEEELLLAYAVECLAMEVLKKAYDIFPEKLYEREGKYPGEYHFLDDEEMRRMPELLKEMKIREVSCNEAFALVPQKTVVFMTEVSDKKNAGCISVCETCGREDCPNRTRGREVRAAGLNYGYQRILGNGGNRLWRKD